MFQFNLLPDINLIDTTKINNMRYMFYKCSTLSSLPDISNWNTSNVLNMSYMFFYCSSLSKLPDISKWNTDKVTDMNNMFEGCKSFSLLIKKIFSLLPKIIKYYFVSLYNNILILPNALLVIITLVRIIFSFFGRN